MVNYRPVFYALSIVKGRGRVGRLAQTQVAGDSFIGSSSRERCMIGKFHTLTDYVHSNHLR